MKDGWISCYDFWPSEKVDALFAKKISYKQFFFEMKKLYERAFLCKIEVQDALEGVIEELSLEKQLELLQTIKARAATSGASRRQKKRKRNRHGRRFDHEEK